MAFGRCNAFREVFPIAGTTAPLLAVRTTNLIPKGSVLMLAKNNLAGNCADCVLIVIVRIIQALLKVSFQPFPQFLDCFSSGMVTETRQPIIIEEISRRAAIIALGYLNGELDSNAFHWLFLSFRA